ncbi:MAG: malonate decarboxylase subunit alpha [Dehalococcoidia bacterium]|nr:malonate decarboxylase subunit alpha [Dehalococcoidia bacterium]
MKIITAERAAELIPSNSNVTVSGLIGNMVPEAILEQLEARFLATGQPRDITEIHPWLYGGPNGTGLNRWAHEGLLKRIIGSTYILPTLSKDSEINQFIFDEKVRAHCWPANAIFQNLRATAGGRKGYLTTIGLDTFADPRRDGGRLNAAAKDDDLIQVVNLDGEEHLYYRSLPINVALIKASTADTEGNLICDDEGLTQGILNQATAAHNSGGIVIAQVRRIVQAGSMHPLMVEVPGVLVDYVVLHEAGLQWDYGANMGDAPATTGARRLPLPDIAYFPHSADKVIARRALMECKPGQVVNIGAGIPGSMMPVTAIEEHLDGKINWSVEHGVFGGHCMSATHWNPTAITSPTWLLDYYNGGGLDQSFLAMPEVDRYGNVNVGKMGGQLPCPGGFTDIATGTKKVTFCGAMTGGNLQVEAEDGTLRIIQEGQHRRFVDDVQMVCFSGRRAVETGQEIKYITERAVFSLTPDGLQLDEVAPGIDVKREVLAAVGFPICISPDLKLMDDRLFRPEPMFLGLD